MSYTRALPYTKLDILGCHRPIHNAYDDDCRERNTEAYLTDQWGCGTKGGRGNQRSSVIVYNDGNEHIEGNCDTLFKNEGFAEVARILEFRLERKESDVAGYARSV